MLAIMLLAVVFPCSEGNQRVVHVSELISDDKDFFTNGQDDNSYVCCVYGNCTCNSLDHALANLTSNLLVNITTNMMLSSLIKASDIQNVSIVGHNNPTVNCKHVGGIHFTFCHSCSVQGITLDGCGTKISDNLTESGIKWNYSSNVTIQNCSFQHSIGQTLVLSEVSGDVNINNCNFVNNSHYRGHGAAIYYSYLYTSFDKQSMFIIKNCIFTDNRDIKSVVYIESRLFKYHKIIFNNSVFSANQGISVYVINNKIYINGIVLFKNNVAEDGAGIYISDHSTVIFGENSNVTFSHNLADIRGGAIFLKNHSVCLFDENSIVTFNYNKATEGGAIYSSSNSNIVIAGNTRATVNSNVVHYKILQAKARGIKYSIDNFHNTSFEENFSTVFFTNATNYGGAIHCDNNCHASFEKASTIVFSNNTAYGFGGAICSYDSSYMSFQGNSATAFINNIAKIGGAINIDTNSHISFEENSTTLFSDNTAYYNGGAVATIHNSRISFQEKSTAVFCNNSADDGGAIYFFDNSNLSFTGNSVTTFCINIAYHGGAIDSFRSYITFKENSVTSFINNTAQYTGAIHCHKNGYISLERNSMTVFINNYAEWYGGAITLSYNVNISFEGNSTAVFSNNSAGYEGGAIQSHHSSYISFEGNSVTMFSNNTADHDGGAIYSEINSHVLLQGNSATLFDNNNANNRGGAIYSDKNSYITFDGNSVTVFTNNTAYHGHAIHFELNSYLCFEGDSTIVFSNNKNRILHSEYKMFRICKENFCTVFTYDLASHVQSMLSKNNILTVSATIFCLHNSKIVVNEHSSIIFKDHLVKWCTDVCLPYLGETDAAIIDSDGLIWSNNLKAFNCLSDTCYCKDLKKELGSVKNNQLVNITDEVVVLSSVVDINAHNISIIGHNNPTVFCVNSSGLRVYESSNLTVEGITWIGCGTSEHMYANYIPVLAVTDSSNLIFQRCSFLYSMGQVISLKAVSGYVNITNCTFVNSNNYRSHGTAIAIRDMIDKVNVFTMNNCDFNSNKGAMSVIYIVDFSKNCITYFINSSFQNNEGASMYILGYHILRVIGEVLFETNVAEDGAGMYISNHSTVVFGGENSNIRFINNSAYHNGAAIFLNNNSSAIFDNNSIVKFYHNKANSGTVYSAYNSSVMFKPTCNVTFSKNIATQYGAAIYSFINSQIVFAEYSSVTFNNNIITLNDAHLQHGGTILSQNNSNILFKDNSVIMFSNNSANVGSAIFCIHNSNVVFKDSSKVIFSNNKVHYCGVLASAILSNITFTDNAIVTFDTNIVSYSYISSGGTICALQRSEIIFTKHSLVTFINNKADRGGAVIIFESSIIIEEYSTVILNNNVALYSSGGAFVCSNNSNVTIKGNSNVTFNNNKASQSGGAIHSYKMCRITFKDNSTSTFTSNTARNNGGAIFSAQASLITIEGSSTVIFDGNTAVNGGVIHITNSTVLFIESSLLLFCNNKAIQNGGVGYVNFDSQVMFEGTVTVTFHNNLAEQIAGVLYCEISNIVVKGNSTIIISENKATLLGGALFFNHSCDITFSEFSNIKFNHNKAVYGGVILANDHSNITVTGKSVLSFFDNEATQSGGAGYFNYSCNFIIKENAMVTFNCNKALEGGAVYINCKTKFTIKGNCSTFFCNNIATVGGGAVKVLNHSKFTLKDHINIKFTSNNAQYGGAIFLDTTAVMVNDSNKNCLNFTNNIAIVLGNSVYQDVTEFYNSSCVSDRLVGFSSEFVGTPPNELKFYDPAICIDNDNDTQCNSYYVQNVMLGTEIVLPACVLNYYNKPIDSIHFLVQSDIYSNYFISGPKQILISCDPFYGIRYSIHGNKTLSQPVNFSINIVMNIALNSNWKQISVSLITELSPCHPGFWQYPNSKICECYNASDIVFCSSSSSTIKRGYWFGSVAGKPTVTFCPINYCNFTCCETSNGYYHLSPVRDNQCRPHRSGIACGRCEKGYTLSFDSVECVHLNKCGIGWTVLVLALVVLYWIILIAAVFSLMHFKVGIGYLYAITYYYSVIDLLLSQNWYHSNTLYITINVMSSVAKVIPQFLGQFCFITNMSGIDQQFIHYIHPVAISLFLVMITVLARRSHRLSSFISKGIIHVICCLLLLSYTSLATTSLLLMRPLIFHDVDKVYTYVSPDVEYFYGRHLVYAIVAVLSTIVIVIGLPLLLALEPFLNSKINFIKIKPLLDQFQGCYKDKYRCFAAYYMICRLIIIIIIIANSSSDFIFQSLLISTCVMMDLAHQIFKPYSNSLLNNFDGVILHFLVLVSVLPLAEIHNDFNPNLAAGIISIYIMLPLLIFITMSLIINKDKVKSLPGYCYLKCSQLHLRYHNCNEIPLNEIPLIKTEESSNEDEYINVIDDRKRENATICEV